MEKGKRKVTVCKLGARQTLSGKKSHVLLARKIIIHCSPLQEEGWSLSILTSSSLHHYSDLTQDIWVKNCVPTEASQNTLAALLTPSPTRSPPPRDAHGRTWPPLPPRHQPDQPLGAALQRD